MINRKIVFVALIGISGLVVVLTIFYLGGSIARADREFPFPRENDVRPGGPPIFLYISISLIFSGGLLVASLMFWYYYPEIRPKANRNGITPNASPLEVLKYLSSDQEVSVIEILEENGNIMYQFEIADGTGLSRMKVHRILAKFEAKDIISKEKIGKSNKIHLSRWLIQEQK